MRRKIPDEIKPILEEVKRELTKIYGDGLRKIILYGSFARGDTTDGSDIDIIILLEEMTEPITEREKYFDAIWKLDLKYDTVISIIPFKEEEFIKRRLPIILNARREGIPV
jgi:predicted nucleotidyltransferase